MSRAKPLFENSDIKAVSNQIRSSWLGSGKRVSDLEYRMMDWVGARYAYAFGSGTAALAVAFINLPINRIRVPRIGCEAFKNAAIAANVEIEYGDYDLDVTVFPREGGLIEDYARHLPVEGAVKLRAPFGVFSFGPLKDVTGGLGGCLVTRYPVDTRCMQQVSPLSDINAAMIHNQLDRYDGHAELRIVAGGEIWRAP